MLDAAGARSLMVADRRQAILVVDDEASVRALVRAALGTRADRYSVVEARNGSEAIEAALATPPDLVLLDVALPDQDGFAVCRAIKANPDTAHVTVIMLTAMNFPTDRQRASEAGADEYMAKPFSPRALLALVEAKLGGEPARQV